MAEMESAHGKLSPVDQKWTAPRFLALLAGTLVVALAFLYFIASFHGDRPNFGWDPLAHDIVKHTVESSSF